MRVLVVEPGFSPYEAFFKSGSEAVEKIIKQESQTLLPFENDVIALVCSRSKDNLVENRIIDENTVIYGRFFICGWTGDHIKELTKKQADRYSRRYFYPERFETNERGLKITPVDPKVKPADERLGKKGWFMER